MDAGAIRGDATQADQVTADALPTVQAALSAIATTEVAMLSGNYSMVLNVDGYTTLDGWLSISKGILLAADQNYAIAGSIVDADGALNATISIRPSESNALAERFHFEDVVLSGAVLAGNLTLHGRSGDTPIELRGRRNG